jgi:hypothetical protein
MQKKVVIVTAGIPVTFSCVEERLLLFLRNRYSDYLTETESGFEIRIDLVESLDCSELDRLGIRHTVSDRKKIHFRTESMCGVLDDEKRSGNVQLLHGKFMETFGAFYLVLFTRLAARQEWTFVHASGLVKNGKAFLFVGPSGAGKTTVSRMAKGADLIHDDQLFLADGRDRPMVITLPFVGREDFLHGKTQSYPVERIFFLHKDRTSFLVPLSSARALGRILTVRQEDLGTQSGSARIERSLERCHRLVQAAQCYEMHFTLDSLPEEMMEAN